ncbi:MAG: DUF1223 domain-containing protein [Rhodospirillales bacterium]|nr:DUF1223 domain-containing protein [Rhodospirillales bacterium]
MFKSLSALALGLIVASGAPAVGAQSLTVVELFTSQGCSSCPPAEAFLGELARRPDVLAISEHVNYWDYLGWVDPFADDAITQRQRRYARRLGLNYVYTPQIVVRGQTQTTGADRTGVLKMIAQADPAISTDLRVTRAGENQLVIDLPAADVRDEVDVWLVEYDPEQTTSVDRGENRGRSIRGFNVVRNLERLTTWRGEPRTFSVVVDSLSTGGKCAILVQQADAGPILAAVRADTATPANSPIGERDGKQNLP